MSYKNLLSSQRAGLVSLSDHIYGCPNIRAQWLTFLVSNQKTRVQVPLIAFGFVAQSAERLFKMENIAGTLREVAARLQIMPRPLWEPGLTERHRPANLGTVAQWGERPRRLSV